MTKLELKKSHDAMARHLLRLCKNSDENFRSRSPECEEFYLKSRNLIKRAGIKYEPEQKRLTGQARSNLQVPHKTEAYQRDV